MITAACAVLPDVWGQEPAEGGSDPAAGHHHPDAVLPALLGAAH